MIEAQLSRGESPAALSAVDPDTDPLVYTLVDGDLPAGLTLNADGTWSGEAQETGTFVVSVESCDPYGLCAAEVLTITVTDIALPATDTADLFDAEGYFAQLRISVGLALALLGVAAVVSRRPQASVVRSDDHRG